MAQGVIAHTAVARASEPGSPGQPTLVAGQIPAELQGLADEYLAVEIPDWAARVRAKDELALRLGSYVIAHRVSKDLLAVQENEGLLVGLASAVNALPESADGQRLVTASARLTRLHVKYRFTMAFASLIQKRLLTPDELRSVQQVLDGFMQGADWSLRARVEGTRALARGDDQAGAP